MNLERTLGPESEPVPAELAGPTPHDPFAHRSRVVRIGRVRLPLTPVHRPWATLYRTPDGRRWWVVRLWEVDRAVYRCLPTSTLLAFARRSRLRELEAELRTLLARSE